MTDGKQTSPNKDVCYQKILYSGCMCSAYLICGWILAQTSTALLDLQKITSVTLDESSLYITFLSFGFIVGSFTYGVVCNIVDKFLLQFLALTLAAICMAIVPWCQIHTVMVIVHTVVGFCNGIVDSAVNAEMLAVWGSGGRSFMQAMYFSDSVGGIISPLVTAQFLSPIPHRKKQTFSHQTSSHRSNFSNITTPIDRNDNQVNYESSSGLLSGNVSKGDSPVHLSVYQTSQLSHAYFISCGIIMIVALAYFAMFFSFKAAIYSDRVTEEVTSTRDIPIYRKLFILTNMGLMAMVYTAIEESFSGFLPAFCTTQLNWSKSNASYVLCVFYSCIGLGRLVAIFWVPYLNPKNIFGILCLSISTALSVLLWCGQNYMNGGIWVSVAMIGFFFATILPSVFTWTEEDFFPVTGQISSFFNIASDCGAAINPVVIGTLMEHRSPMWFVYVLLTESFPLLMTYAVGIFLSRRQKANDISYQEME